MVCMNYIKEEVNVRRRDEKKRVKKRRKKKGKGNMPNN